MWPVVTVFILAKPFEIVWKSGDMTINMSDRSVFFFSEETFSYMLIGVFAPLIAIAIAGY